MFELAAPRPARHTRLEALEGAWAAAARESVAGPHTLRLVELLYALNRDAEIVTLLRDRPMLGEARQALTLWLARALAASGERSDEAGALFVQAGALATHGRARAEANSGLALALLEQGRTTKARLAIDHALAEDPDNPRTMRQLAIIYLRDGAERALLAYVEKRLADGLCHAGILAAHDMARAALGMEIPAPFAFLAEHRPAVPPGWPSLESFHAALAVELTANPGRHPSRIGGEGGVRLRIDELWLEARSNVTPDLLRMLRSEVEIFARTLQGNSAWIDARPERAAMRSWSVITRDGGHDRWHMHVEGWMSGVYYVRTPGRGDAGGGIEFGMPDLPGLPGPPKGARRLIHPEAGQMLVFPSHLHHRTHPTGLADARISVAFDVIPAARR
jgi:uncharacterized protein (TIGR02466 family)